MEVKLQAKLEKEIKKQCWNHVKFHPKANKNWFFICKFIESLIWQWNHIWAIKGIQGVKGLFL